MYDLHQVSRVVDDALHLAQQLKDVISRLEQTITDLEQRVAQIEFVNRVRSESED